jgi:hypothetical protein
MTSNLLLLNRFAYSLRISISKYKTNDRIKPSPTEQMCRLTWFCTIVAKLNGFQLQQVKVSTKNAFLFTYPSFFLCL